MLGARGGTIEAHGHTIHVPVHALDRWIERVSRFDTREEGARDLAAMIPLGTLVSRGPDWVHGVHRAPCGVAITDGIYMPMWPSTDGTLVAITVLTRSTYSQESQARHRAARQAQRWRRGARRSQEGGVPGRSRRRPVPPFVEEEEYAA